MSRYGQYCPITRSLEVLGDRWTLLIVRDLLVGVTRFNELARGLPRLSRGLLSKRLDELQRHGIVQHVDGRYLVTEAGEELRPVVFGLAEWGARWAFGEPRPDELDPTVLMWWIRGGIDPGAFGRRRVVIHVLLPDGERRRYWLVVESADVSLCFTDPGFEVDVLVESPLGVLYQVWEGRIPLKAAQRDGLLRLSGKRELVRAFPSALQLSPVAPYVVRAGVSAGRGDPG
ncbi:winged helix-turn-helix transcriptional regulator [Pseudonocardia sp. TRM90224]|uniref:winged helix-turn-helix transcriptional regulator n=1 Tax=Pseudonocardia sp. TRM90224 TaxID=2812678 RepID=UPI001E38DF0F|nr:helix-turn-helix domain-containing protein [Pseudonocardia sp. TRM90224]